MFTNDKELFRFDLQLCADLPGVQDDDGKPDLNDETEDTIEDAELDEILKKLGGNDDEEEPEEEEQVTDEDEGEPTDEDQQPEEIEEIVQQRVVEELNRIIPERLKRDRKTQQVAHLEQLTGMNLEQITKTVLDNMVADKAEELGISEDEARKIVDVQIENANHKAEKTAAKETEQETSAAMQQVKYLQDKMNYMKKPKLAGLLKDCEAEIDAFTGKGSLLSFEDGMKYVLGGKLATGELIKKVQAGAEQKATRNIEKKSKAVPQSKSGTKSDAPVLTKEEKQIAAFLGVPEKEYAEEKLDISKSKRRKAR